LKNDTDWHKGGGGGLKVSEKWTRIIWTAPESGSFEKRHVLGSLQMNYKNIDSTSNRVGFFANEW